MPIRFRKSKMDFLVTNLGTHFDQYEDYLTKCFNLHEEDICGTIRSVITVSSLDDLSALTAKIGIVMIVPQSFTSVGKPCLIIEDDDTIDEKVDADPHC
jgi:hypothetical protein